ncbi:MAG: ExbD/TolR family protein [Zoogloeaceae bacterium]|jgi:biopolymer transport protein TolR|nr:ExbD/TolR family protein [Zoogloeaceae bacterium]
MARRPRRLKNEINVVPYIDVMLVLLVIFMVAAPMMQTGSVDLPAVDKANLVPNDPLRVEVSASGELKITDASGLSRAINKAELAAALAVEKEKNPQLAVLVAGDKAASYESVLNVLDEIKALDFERVGLETGRK